MDGSRKRIRGTGHQMLLLKKPREDDKYLRVEYFSIYHNSGDQLEKYFGSLKLPVSHKFIFFFQFYFWRTMYSFHTELNTISSIDSKC